MVGTAAVLFAMSASRIDRSWESEVVYHVFPRSFRDSNGDRIGDFRGIEDGLDAIQKLGATTILLNPVYKGRTYHNYFADDWFDVDPELGTLADFRHLCEAAHAKGIRIVLDMEPQYAADGHPWYKAALKDKNAKERSYFADDLSENPFGNSPWYDKQQIQLASINLSHPDVVRAITENFLFWCQQGIDGFRIDHMMDDLDWKGKNTNLYKNLWKPVEEKVKQSFPSAWFIGEQAEWESFRACVEVFEKTPTDAVFNFRLYNAFLTMKRASLEKALNEYGYFTPKGRMQANFLENHDLPRYATAEESAEKRRAAAGILIAARGIPSIYYGQELGMKGLQGHWNSDGNDIPVRLAYRWGATLEDPHTPTWYKGTGPWDSNRFTRDHDGISYQEQDADQASLLNWYRKLITIRKDSKALSTGTQQVVDLGADQVLAFDRLSGTEKVRVLANLSDKAASVDPGVKGRELIDGHAVDGKVNLQPWQVVYIQGSP